MIIELFVLVALGAFIYWKLGHRNRPRPLEYGGPQSPGSNAPLPASGEPVASGFFGSRPHASSSASSSELIFPGSEATPSGPSVAEMPPLRLRPGMPEIARPHASPRRSQSGAPSTVVAAGDPYRPPPGYEEAPKKNPVSDAFPPQFGIPRSGAPQTPRSGVSSVTKLRKVKPKDDSADRLKAYRFTGTFRDRQIHAILEGKDELQIVKEGDFLEGFKIVHLDESRMVLRKKDKELIIGVGAGGE